MSTMPNTDRGFWQRWKEFWFTPGDPTTLGFIRIVTGLLMLYIHLAYSLDLQAFFGRQGWYGASYVERERHEYPWVISSLGSNTLGWDEEVAQPRVPEHPHRRQAVMQFIRGLPPSVDERTRDVRFLDRVFGEPPQAALTWLDFLSTFYLNSLPPEEGGSMSADDAVRQAESKKVYAALTEGRQLYASFQRQGVFYLDSPNLAQNSPPLFPGGLLGLPTSERATAVAELQALATVLPRDRTDAKYLFAHIIELNPAQRRALLLFIKELPNDKVERDRRIDYLEYWNHDPTRLYRQGHPLVSVWFHVNDPTQMALIHGFTLVVMALFTIGFLTRVTSVLTWIAVVGYVHRTNQILFGMDTMMNILLVYLVIGNSGAALSVDRLIARYRAIRASLRRTGTIDEATRAFLSQAPPSAGAAFGTRLIQVHFCFIYLAAGLSKLKGEGWWNGGAFWEVMVNPEFTLLRYHWFENMVRSLASIKPLYYLLTALGVWFTWGLEITFPFLVWTRLRPIMVWMGVLLHAGIGVLMGLNLFELLMMTMLLVYLPPGVIRDRLRGGPGLPKLGYRFDPAIPRQARAAAVVGAVDVDGQAQMECVRGAPGVVVTEPGGGTATGSAGASALFRTLRMLGALRFVGAVPGVPGLLARWVAPTSPNSAKPGNGGTKTGPQAPAAAS